MSENQCQCGKPSKDATICTGCAYQLDAAISSISEHHGLAWDLSIAASKQAVLGERNGSRSTETAVPFDRRVGDTAKDLRNILLKWARVVADGIGVNAETNRRGIGPICPRCHHISCHAIPAIPEPPDDLAHLAAWMRPRVGWMRYHHQAAQALNEITVAVRQARRVIDRPADKLYAGPCDCGEDLYARVEAAYATCRNTECRATWDVADRRAWLLKSAEDVLATTTEISRALTRYQQPVTPNMIYGYVHRKQLIAKGSRIEGHREIPLYRVGDVLDILARQAEKVAS